MPNSLGLKDTKKHLEFRTHSSKTNRKASPTPYRRRGFFVISFIKNQDKTAVKTKKNTMLNY